MSAIADRTNDDDAVALDAERSTLAELENTIEKGLVTFLEVGQALTRIRDDRLYLISHTTFEEYCGERWGIKRAYAYHLIEAAAVVERVSTIVNIGPSKESQCRELARLPDDEQAEAWSEAVESAGPAPVTAKHVAAVVKKRKKPDAPKPKSVPSAFLIESLIERIELPELPENPDAVTRARFATKKLEAIRLAMAVNPTARRRDLAAALKVDPHLLTQLKGDENFSGSLEYLGRRLVAAPKELLQIAAMPVAWRQDFAKRMRDQEREAAELAATVEAMNAAAELAAIETMDVPDRPGESKRPPARTTARERRQDDDDAVRRNIPADLVPVFDKLRRSIKGSPNRSRTEAFLQWAEENPGEVLAVQMALADREVKKLIRHAADA